MSDKNQYTIKEAIQELLKTYKLDGKMNELKIINSWEKVMGKVIAKHTLGLNIHKGKMYVKVDSSALREELHYAREKIIKMLNDEAGVQVIDEIILK